MLSHMCSVERIEGGMGASTCPCLSPARVAAMIGDRTNVTIGDVYIPYGSAPNASFPSSYGVYLRSARPSGLRALQRSRAAACQNSSEAKPLLPLQPLRGEL